MGKSRVNTESGSFWDKVLMVVWPIEKKELKKFLPMSFMMLCILYVFSSLRMLKDALVIPSIGAEVISFAKLYCVMPSAVLVMMLYAKLTNVMKYENIFYTLVGFFVAFLAVFVYVLYPNADLIHPSPQHVEHLAASLPWFKWFFRLWGKWSYALFYVIAELWGSVVLNLLFWQFANQITRNEEARRFYGMFGLIGNVGLIITGNITKHLTVNYQNEAIPYTIMICTVLGVVTMAIYRWMHVNVLTDPQYYDPSQRVEKKKKVKLSMVESFKMIMSSKYIGYIFIIVFSYGMAINMVEGPWKDKIRELYPNANDYLSYMANFMKYMGYASIAFMLIGTNILRCFGWLISAMTTPVMVLVTGLIFFACVVFEKHVLGFIGQTIYSPVYIAVMIGAAQNVLSKATKYSLYDATREMTYIPIDENLKTKGKAAMDVVGSRLAKSGGAFLQSSLFFIFPSFMFNDLAPILMVVFSLICFLWIYAVKKLGVEYNNALEESKKNAAH